MSGEGNNEASGGGTAGIATVGGEAIGQRGEGAGAAEPSTPGQEVVHLARGPGAGVECNTLARLTPAVAFDERAAVTCTACLHTLLALNEDGRDRWRQRAEQAESRMAELEDAARWVPVGERLPVADTLTLTVDTFGTVAVVRYHGLRWNPYVRDTLPCWGAWDDFTHWRPLPAGPEVQP